LKDNELEVVYLSILKTTILPYRLRLYGEATAFVGLMIFEEICGFEKFAIFWVVCHPGDNCCWNIDR